MTRSHAIVPMLLAAAACQGEPPPAAGSTASAPPAATATTAPSATARTAAPAGSATRQAGAPRKMETKAAPDTQVGTLPADVGIAVGKPAPDVSVQDAGGKTVRLRDLWTKGPIALVFYRGGWCPYCNFQIHALTQAHGEFQKRGVTPVALSVDREDEAAKTNATYTIPFPVLSDPDLAAHRAFRVVHHAGDEEVTRLKGFGIDIERSSGKTHHDFAIPSCFVIDQKGVVRWAHADPDYKVRPSVKQLLAAVDGLALPRPAAK